MMAKILVFATEGSQIESSFIGDPGRPKRTAPFTRSSLGAIYPPQMQHTKPSHTNEATHKPLRMNDATRKSRRKVTQLLTRSPRIGYLSFTYSPNHWHGGSWVVL
ncbi:hypothetical protein TNCV_3139121 [Trichonephila clavipes]|nr:hypothetical protein TNCV_3139121 [Trichonephila clavipes]